MDTNPLAKDMTVSFEIGQPVTVELKASPPISGFVHAVDRVAGLLCLELIPNAEPVVIALHNVVATNRFQVTQHTERNWPSKPVIDVPKVRAEEERVLKKKHADYARVGVDVSPMAQAIFDKLAKTLPCKWQRNVIVVLDTVYLSPPYDIKSISGNGDATEVDRVKMILERESKSIRDAADVNGIAS